MSQPNCELFPSLHLPINQPDFSCSTTEFDMLVWQLKGETAQKTQGQVEEGHGQCSLTTLFFFLFTAAEHNKRKKKTKTQNQDYTT